MVLDGTRLPSQEMVGKLSRYFRHTPVEHKYFDLMVSAERLRRAGRFSQASDAEAEMDVLQPVKGGRVRLVKEAEFQLIAQWSHLVIASLAASPNFKESPAWIKKRLRNKVSAAEVIQALRSLELLGFLERQGDGRFEVKTRQSCSGYEVPNQAIRQHHRQMLERAIEALEEQHVSMREISSVTLSIDPSRMAEAKDFIEQFRDAFNLRFQSGANGRVFQFNVQFFEHTIELGSTNK